MHLMRISLPLRIASRSVRDIEAGVKRDSLSLSEIR